jgi:hypothetical protein
VYVRFKTSLLGSVLPFLLDALCRARIRAEYHVDCKDFLRMMNPYSLSSVVFISM